MPRHKYWQTHNLNLSNHHPVSSILPMEDPCQSTLSRCEVPRECENSSQINTNLWLLSFPKVQFWCRKRHGKRRSVISFPSECKWGKRVAMARHKIFSLEPLLPLLFFRYSSQDEPLQCQWTECCLQCWASEVASKLDIYKAVSLNQPSLQCCHLQK